jgi:hypothetical protein
MYKDPEIVKKYLDLFDENSIKDALDIIIIK